MRSIHPSLLLRIANPFVVALGLAPTLSVTGRRSGRVRTVPFGGPFGVDGRRYLVAGRGLTDWARNLRAAGAGRLRIRGREEAFRAIEVDGAERDGVLAAYRRHYGRSVRRYFELVPDSRDHPVFRVEPL